MKYEDKSKDELIFEIKELLQKYNFLNNSIDKYIAEREVALKMFQDIIDKNPMSIQILDLEGYTIQVNSAHTKLFGVVPPPTYSLFNDAQLLKIGFGELFNKIKEGEVVHFPIAYYNAHDIDSSFPDIALWLKAIGLTLNDINGKPEKIVLIHDNVTQSQLAENELHESKKMLELVMDSIPQFIFWKDRNSVFLGCNKNLALVAGLNSASEIIGKTDYELVWKKEEADFFVECDRRIINSGIAEYHIIEPQLQANGKQAWLDTNKVPIFNDSGEVIGILGTYEDITERMQTEATLKKSEERFALVIKASEQGIWDWNVETNEVYFSPQWKNMIGYSDDELKNEFDNWIEHLHPDEKETCINAVQAYINNPTEQFTLDFRFRHKDGTYRWIHNKASSVRNSEGKVIRMFGTHLDITEKKQSELIIQEKTEEIKAQNKEYLQLNEQLLKTNSELIKAKQKAEESELQFRNLFESAADAIFIAEQESGRIVDANQAAEKLLQLPYNEIIGLNQANLHPAEVEKYSIETFREANESDVINLFENKVVRANGTEVPVEILASAVFYKGKKCLMGTFRDITERKKAELEIIKAKEKAEESDRLKTAFLQNMSHEIRTPMNAIMGFSSLLVDNYGNRPKLEQFSTIINERCSDLLDIINDLLDISKIESGQLSVNIENCNITELFTELNLFFKEYQNRIGKQHIIFNLQYPSDKSITVIQTDKLKLKQILINLISNAFKFTEKGSIELGCNHENNQLIFYVSDTGIGIAADKHNEIFERFTQLNHPSIKNIGGTGLGLSIVKGLIGLLGGKIWIDSQPENLSAGKAGGSTFYFSINCITSDILHQDRVLLKEDKKFRFSDKTILIVEDDRYNAEYLKEILTNKGFNIITTMYGEGAIQIAKNQPIDLILMDIRLPDLNGYEATRLIKQWNPQAIIIAQTAYASQDERQKAMDAGCIDYISKPTKQELLLTLICKYLTVTNNDL